MHARGMAVREEIHASHWGRTSDERQSGKNAWHQITRWGLWLCCGVFYMLAGYGCVVWECGCASSNMPPAYSEGLADYSSPTFDDMVQYCMLFC